MGKNRRAHRRLRIDAAVKAVDGGREYLFPVLDLSRVGVFLHSAIGHIYPFGVGSQLEVELESRGRKLRCRAEVMRVVEGGSELAYTQATGFGCRLHPLGPDSERQFDELLESAERDVVARGPGNLLRALFLFLLVSAYLVLYGVGSMRARIRARMHGGNRRAELASWRGEVLRRGMTRLGAMFIKMGQVMSTRPDLFPAEVVAELRRLQDRLPPFSMASVRRIVEEELGAPLDELYSEFDETPVAAASTAQVHRARLRDGTEVAVKVLRPDIRKQVERDAAVLLLGARLLALHPVARLSDPVGHLRHFVNAIVDQTDLSLEQANYQRFRQNFAGHSEVAFPTVYASHSGRRVLTMEFVRGRKIDEISAGDHPGLAATVRTAVFRMCFEHGFVHADLHPGNMVVAETGGLVLFDVGLVKLLHEDVLAQFIDMAKCLSMGTADDIVAHLRRYHRYLADAVDWAALRAEVELFAARFRGRRTSELEYRELFGEMYELGRRHNVRPVTDMTVVFVALVTAEGIGKQLNPGGNVFAELTRFLLPILQRRETPPSPPPRGSRPASAALELR